MVRRSHRTTTHSNGGFLSRLRGRRGNTTVVTTTTTTRTTSPPEPVTPHHTTRRSRGLLRPQRTVRRPGEPLQPHHRRPTIGDKISGAFMKLEGTLTRRPGLKVRICEEHLVRRLTIISRLLALGECTELMDVTCAELTKISQSSR